MDSQRIDQLARLLAAGASRRQALKAFAASVAAGIASALGASSARAAPPQDKVNICHRTGSASNPVVLITVSQNAEPAHMAHGDTKAPPCQGGQLQQDCTCRCPTGTDLCQGNCHPRCTGGRVRNPNTCKCECPTGTEVCRDQCVALCRPDQVRNPTTCRCECPAGTEECNGRCVDICRPDQERNPNTCECVCRQVTCSPGQQQNPSTCKCECIKVDCPAGQQQNQETCGCECIPRTCPAPKRQNPLTCECECPNKCSPGESQDPDTCECISGPDPVCAGRTCDNFSTCADRGDCFCFTTFDGGGFCAVSVSCAALADCGPAGECPDGTICLVDTCCVRPVCKPLTFRCDPGPGVRQITPIPTGDGPTTANR